MCLQFIHYFILITNTSRDISIKITAVRLLRNLTKRKRVSICFLCRCRYSSAEDYYLSDTSFLLHLLRNNYLKKNRFLLSFSEYLLDKVKYHT